MFNDALKPALQKLLQEFLIEDRGNRITSTLMSGFGLKMNVLFAEFEMKGKEDGKRKDGDNQGDLGKDTE